MPSPHLLLLNNLLLDVTARRIKRLMVFMPPRHGKSTFISKYFAAWYLGNFPNQNVILASYEATYAATWGEQVRDLMAEFGPALWDLQVKHNRRKASDWRLEAINGRAPVVGGMRTAGIGSGLTGRGGNLILIDDPVKDQQDANSTIMRQRNWDWYQSVLSTRKDRADAVEVLVMTRWHGDDLAGRMLAHAADSGEPWTVVNLPALCEEEGDLLGRAVGDALWPDRWPVEALETQRSNMDPYWWAALYQQRPAPAGGGIFKKVWWRFWKPLGSDLPQVEIPIEGEESFTAMTVELPRRLDSVLQSWDLTFDSSRSKVVGEVWAKKGANAYLLDEARGSWEFPGQLEQIRRLTRKWPQADVKLIEKKANAAAAIATLRNEIPGLIPVEPEGDKETRARAVTTYVESGNVYLPHPAIAPWVWDFIAEHAVFPNGTWDDRVDTTSQALRRMYGSGIAEPVDPRAWPTVRA